MRLGQFVFAVTMAVIGVSLNAQGSAAKNQALLVGVSTYTGGARAILRDLRGPKNDVTQIWRYLTASGFAPENIAVLADEMPVGDAFPKPVGPPTYAAIRQQLEKLAAAKYDPGDVVTFYFSGHGVTSPDDNPAAEPDPEADGRDQVLLPADTGMFFTDTARIENGLVDDEIGAYLSRIRQQGATVWAIIDSCFAGSSTRGGDVSKTVDPALLGIPTGALPQVQRRGADARGPVDGVTAAQGPGQLIGFYAVDEFNKALINEFEFARYQEPVVEEAGKRNMSVFTYFLIQALNQGNAHSYRDLFQEVIAAMASDRKNASVARPVADGDLEQTVPGRQGAGASRIRALLEGEKITIPAGSLQGFAKGAGVTLFSPDQMPLATATIESANAVSSIAGRIAWMEGVAPLPAASLPVQVTQPVTQAVYAVARPDRLSGDDAAAISDMLDEAFLPEEARRQYGITLVAAGDTSANLVVKVEDGRIWLLKPGESFIKDENAFGKSFSIDIGSDRQEQLSALKDSIWRLARAEKLIRVAEAVSRSAAADSDLNVSIGRYRKDRRASRGNVTCPDRRKKPLSSEEVGALVDVTRNLNVGAGNCDIFRVGVANSSDETSYYVAAYYVDARGGVLSLRTGSQKAITCGYVLAADTQTPLSFDVQIATWDSAANKPASVGAEHIVVLAVERDANRAMPAFCALSQASLPGSLRTRGETSAIRSLFDGIIGGTRGESLTTAGLKSNAFRLDFDVAP